MSSSDTPVGGAGSRHDVLPSHSDMLEGMSALNRVMSGEARPLLLAPPTFCHCRVIDEPSSQDTWAYSIPPCDFVLIVAEM